MGATPSSALWRCPANVSKSMRHGDCVILVFFWTCSHNEEVEVVPYECKRRNYLCDVNDVRTHTETNIHRVAHTHKHVATYLSKCETEKTR